MWLDLERFARRTADRTWRLDRGLLLAAVEHGESVAAMRELLETHSATPLPPALTDLLGDVAQRTQRFVDRGLMRVIDCTDPALAAQLAHDAKTRGLCFAAGANRLLVPTEQEPAFRGAVRGLGYAIVPGKQLRNAA